MLEALQRKQVVNFRPRSRAVGLPSAHAPLTALRCDSTPGLFKCFFLPGKIGLQQVPCRAGPDMMLELCRACPETLQVDTEIKIDLFARFARVCRNQPQKPSMQGTSKHLLHQTKHERLRQLLNGHTLELTIRAIIVPFWHCYHPLLACARLPVATLAALAPRQGPGGSSLACRASPESRSPLAGLRPDSAAATAGPNRWPAC